MENQISLKINKKEYDYIIKRAQQEDRSISYIVRKLIEKGIEKWTMDNGQ